MFGSDQDDVIIVPYTTGMKRFAGVTMLRSINVQAATAEQMAEVQNGIADLLRQRHRIQPGRDDDFILRNQQEIAETMNATTDVMTALLAAIASVSLLVGGIGIMNIMLVSVTERTREIGIRMAVGARGRDILLQFLIEAVALSSTGGVLGILSGIGGAKLITIDQAMAHARLRAIPSSSPSPSAPRWGCSSAFIPPAKPRSSTP